MVVVVYTTFSARSAFIAQRVEGPRKQMKQITQIEHNIIKNPNWLEANQLQAWRGSEIEATKVPFLL